MNACCPGSLVDQNFLSVSFTTPVACTVTVSPALTWIMRAWWLLMRCADAATVEVAAAAAAVANPSARHPPAGKLTAAPLPGLTIFIVVS